MSRPGGPVELLELPDPDAPAPGHVLVAVEAAGVGPWDPLLHTGEWDVGLRPPAALGVEGAGTVVAVGDGVTGLRPGDAMLAHAAPLPAGSGFWAEQVVLDAAHVSRRPAGLDPVAAAALPVGGLTARQALTALTMRPGERLLLTGGAGGTGAPTLQLAVRAGLVVTATASQGNAQRLVELGAARVIDYHAPDWPDQAKGPFDAALAAAPGTAAAALGLVRDGGRLLALTLDAPPSERGINSENFYVEPDPVQLAELAALVASGALVLTPEAVPLIDGPAALQRVTAGRTGGKKLVLQP